MTPSSDPPTDPHPAAPGARHTPASTTGGTGSTPPDSASHPVPLEGTVSSAGPPASLTPNLSGGVPAKFGPYRIVRQLGEGGMGVVYEATDEVLHHRVALKVMNDTTAANPQFRERFLREGRAVAALNSDHIVRVYAAGEESGLPYLAMEFIDGPTLEVWLQKHPVTTTDVLWVASQLLKGLTAAHARNLIHRDIKPANVMLDPVTGRLKLLDFGLVRDVTPVAPGLLPTATHAVLGTPSYMSPEQALEQQLDPRSDLFSVGTVLYRVVTGRSPFSRETPMKSIFAVVNERPAPLTGVPAPLRDFVARLMAEHPDNRPNDAGAALAELSEVEAEIANTAVPTDPDVLSNPELARPANRKPLRAALAVAAVLLVITAVVLLTRGKSGTETTQKPPEPTPQPAPEPARPPLTAAQVLRLIREDIDTRPGVAKVEPPEPVRLYLFAPHLAPGSSLSAADRAAYRAALDALATHFRPDGKFLRPLDPDRTVFAVEPTGLFRAPANLFASYPYGLSIDQPDAAHRDDEAVRASTGPVAYIRADWFARYAVSRLAEKKDVFGINAPAPNIVTDWATAWTERQVDLATAADELGAGREQVKRSIGEHERLREVFKLGPLAEGKTISRSVWESREFSVSGFHELATVLKLGTPVLTR